MSTPTAVRLIRKHEAELTGLLARCDPVTEVDLHVRVSSLVAEATRDREAVELRFARPVVPVNPFLAGVARG